MEEFNEVDFKLNWTILKYNKLYSGFKYRTLIKV
jgi:hypothetical protein